MTAFRFSLQKALEWRRTQLGLAEAQVQQQLAALAHLDQEESELQAIGRRAEVETRALRSLAGADLAALGSFRLLVKSQERDLTRKRVEQRAELAKRQAAMLESRRRTRLLERLKERRWAEWQAARDKELEELASDSYLARWTNLQHRLQ